MVLLIVLNVSTNIQGIWSEMSLKMVGVSFTNGRVMDLRMSGLIEAAIFPMTTTSPNGILQNPEHIFIMRSDRPVKY